MILPASPLAGLLLMVAALICAGSWPSTFKAAGRWRYELYYFDFSIGAILFAVLAALTLGSMRSSELTFQDNFLIAGYRKMAFAAAAGVVFNLGNVFLLAGISVGGMALCVPLAFGVALLIDGTWDFIADPRGNVLLLFGGIAVLLAAMLLLITAFLNYRHAMEEAARKALTVDPRSKEARRRPKAAAPGVAVAFSIVSGIILCFPPQILSAAREGENGVAPYGLALLFAGAVLFSTFIFSPFIINFPIGNTPARLADYFRATMRQHLLGFFGGALLVGGMLAASVVAVSPPAASLGSGWISGLAQGAPLVAILWGLLAWREYANAGDRVVTFLWGGFVLYGVGVAMTSLAPLYGSR